jgi:hypothetical protein
LGTNLSGNIGITGGVDFGLLISIRLFAILEDSRQCSESMRFSSNIVSNTLQMDTKKRPLGAREFF